jgi:hypothetical protein
MIAGMAGRNRLAIYGSLAPGRPDHHRFEGPGHERVLTTVSTATGQVEAYVHVLGATEVG